MRIVIVVLNWNGVAYIQKCLKSLSKLDTSEHLVEVVVVDNASADTSLQEISIHYPRFKLIPITKNLGYAGGNNMGLNYAISQHADWAWIVNPDVQVAPDTLHELIKASRSSTQIGILGSKSYFAPGFEFHADRYSKKDKGNVLWYAGGKMDWANVESIHLGVNEVDHGQYDLPGPTEFVTGASMFISVPLLREIGLFDPKYFLYYEENDLCQRAICAGWLLWYVPTSTVWHANAQATGIGSNLQDYFLTRNRLLFGMKWAPWRTKISLIRHSLFTILLHGRPWQKRGVIDYYLGHLGPGSYPVK